MISDPNLDQLKEMILTASTDLFREQDEFVQMINDATVEIVKTIDTLATAFTEKRNELLQDSEDDFDDLVVNAFICSGVNTCYLSIKEALIEYLHSLTTDIEAEMTGEKISGAINDMLEATGDSPRKTKKTDSETEFSWDF